MLSSKLYGFLQILYSQRDLVLSMTKREILLKYKGSLLGLVWTIIHPLVFITMFWFIFSVGFRVVPKNDVPFVVWLTAGMAPWFAFSEIISASTNVVTGNATLIKKTIFRSEILPLINVLTSLVNHSVFLIVLFGLLLFQGMEVSFYYLQLFYYLICLQVLALGIAWAVSALNVFIRDVAQMVAVILQVGFWGTPIFWDISMMPERVQFFLKLNPVYYIVQGYRDTFIYFIPFWERPYDSLYFWGVALTGLFLGMRIFQKLKPQFADVL